MYKAVFVPAGCTGIGADKANIIKHHQASSDPNMIRSDQIEDANSCIPKIIPTLFHPHHPTSLGLFRPTSMVSMAPSGPTSDPGQAAQRGDWHRRDGGLGQGPVADVCTMLYDIV